jgi:2-oxoglutarate ferredoxin oxidoreductase subunit beta
MLHWLRECCLPVDRYGKLSAEERVGRFPIGKLVDRDAPDFNTRYEEIRARAMGQKG